MGYTELQSITNYGKLRSAYDAAFRQLAQEVRRVTDRQAWNGSNGSTVFAANAQIASAYQRYTQARNALTEYLLRGRGEDHVLTRSQQPPVSIEERAYFLWEKAGRPRGNDQEHWFSAESYEAC